MLDSYKEEEKKDKVLWNKLHSFFFIGFMLKETLASFIKQCAKTNILKINCQHLQERFNF